MVDKEKEVTTTGTPWPLLTIGIFISIIVMAMIVAGWWATAAFISHVRSSSDDRGMMETRGLDDSKQSQGREQFPSSFGSEMTNGVVTAIDGDTLTVSGHGKQIAVTTNNDTEINDTDSKNVAVNDTIVVFGEEDEDGNVLATHIIVRNNESMNEGGRRGPGTVRVPQT